MIDHVTALYCITDDLLKVSGHREDARRTMCDAEVLTTALTAALYFGGNAEHARRFMRETGADASHAQQVAPQSAAACRRRVGVCAFSSTGRSLERSKHLDQVFARLFSGGDLR